MSVEAGVSEIPLLLSGKAPQNVDDNLGSKNYSQVPVAVATGGGFNEEMVMAMKKACDETAGAEKVPWLKLGACLAFEDSRTPRCMLMQ